MNGMDEIRSYQWYEIQDPVDYYEEFESQRLLSLTL